MATAVEIVELTMQEYFNKFVMEEANAFGSFKNELPMNEYFPQTYNPEWRNHSNFWWIDNPNFQQGPYQPYQGQHNTCPPHDQPQNYTPPQSHQPPQGPTLEELVASMVRTTDSFIKETKSYIQRNDTHMQKTDKAIANLENQVGQIATALSQKESGMMPSQTVINPTGHEHVQAVTLRTGKVIGEVDNSENLIQNDDEVQVEQVTEPKEKDEINKEKNKQAASSPEWIPKHEIARRARKEKVCHEPTDEDILCAPFPHRLMSSKENQHAKDVLETFEKVQVNIPLLDANKLKEYETVTLTEEVFAVLQRKLPPKSKDPGSFTIPCIIGDKLLEKALIDLGASINLMPYSVFEVLKEDKLNIHVPSTNHMFNVILSTQVRRLPNPKYVPPPSNPRIEERLKLLLKSTHVGKKKRIRKGLIRWQRDLKKLHVRHKEAIEPKPPK
ncbi:uncharacterized protein LOC110763970 [Prunus avium]|uniref:Uncharacterized protein LOC110763970 n=1 Tax=Prunus avium TaxID=42229 RepID=A0A6P5T5W0_PRUAV|nr:uncharacterized protein LOC110763970 [Prunus avium]